MLCFWNRLIPTLSIFSYNSDVPARNGFLARNFAVKRENATASPPAKTSKETPARKFDDE